MASTKPQRPHRYITFDPLTFDALKRVTDATGLPLSHVVWQLLRSHVQELDEYAAWIERQGGETWDRAVHALASYGPHTLTTKMQRLDPTYQPPEACVRADMNQMDEAALLGEADMAALHTMLNKWMTKQAVKGAQQ
jgi:methionine synthase I (cobalamin-dependent)